MNTNVVASLAVAVTFLTGLLVITVAKDMGEEPVASVREQASTTVINENYKQPAEETSTSLVSTSVEVVPETVVKTTVTIGQ